MVIDDHGAVSSDRSKIRALLGSIQYSGALAAERLSGGRNSRTYLVRSEDSRDVVVKVYPELRYGAFDRRAAEAEFLDYAARSGSANVARLLATDASLNASMMSRIEGRPLKNVDTVGPAELEQMAAFLRTLNTPSAAFSDLRPAAESCFSIEMHLDLVDRRVRRLVAVAESGGCSTTVRRLLLGDLEPVWRAVRDRAFVVADRRGLDRLHILSEDDRRVSPSDFGLHNALRDSRGAIHFVDFEYAGVDDPAKLICDSINQPRVPIPDSLCAKAVGVFAEALGTDEQGIARVNVLRVPYMVKWACIMLNVVIQTGGRMEQLGRSDVGGVSVKNQVTLAARQIENVRRVMEEPAE